MKVDKHISIDFSLNEKIIEYCKKRGISFSKLVSIAVNNYISSSETKKDGGEQYERKFYNV